MHRKIRISRHEDSFRGPLLFRNEFSETNAGTDCIDVNISLREESERPVIAGYLRLMADLIEKPVAPREIR